MFFISKLKQSLPDLSVVAHGNPGCSMTNLDDHLNF